MKSSISARALWGATILTGFMAGCSPGATSRTGRQLERKIRERIREGSNRIGDALFRMYDLLKAEDREGARQQMRDVLSVEVVPHYREIAEGEIAKIDGHP